MLWSYPSPSCRVWRCLCLIILPFLISCSAQPESEKEAARSAPQTFTDGGGPPLSDHDHEGRYATSTPPPPPPAAAPVTAQPLMEPVRPDIGNSVASSHKVEWAQNGAARALREASLNKEHDGHATVGKKTLPSGDDLFVMMTLPTSPSSLDKAVVPEREQPAKKSDVEQKRGIVEKQRNVAKGMINPVSSTPDADAADLAVKDARRPSWPEGGGKLSPPMGVVPTDNDPVNTREMIQGVTFQEPVGHWANTYVPGDPTIRFLEAQLRQHRQVLVGGGYPDPTLPGAMPTPVVQPADPPWNSALAFTLHADRRGVEGPSRLRVQLGIQGSQRQGGYRPVMKLALILDLRSYQHVQETTLARSLALALGKARQPGDRFLLLALGRQGSLRIDSDHFRHGALQESLAHFFDDSRPPDGPRLDVAQAIALARKHTRLSDEPTATLGSSLILLATPALPPEESHAVELASHESAIQGSPVSFIALAPPADGMAVERIVAAGMGNRRLLTTPEQTEALVDRELLAASQMVARAIRVVFRLAPGVRLVDIPGSYRLDPPQAARVRQAEQALDQHLSRQLGLEADRSEDEEGLRMVIPSFHAGAGHVILLDLVVPGAGPVVDVTVRYKDVVFMKNNVFRQTLPLANHREAPGPLEHNVIKNALAFRFALMLQQAGEKLAANQVTEAVTILEEGQRLLASLRLLLPGWDQDPTLQGDEAFLIRHLSILRSTPPQQPHMRQLAGATLRVAGFRKLMPSAMP
ncbi:MAG: hypothetical protein HQL64_03280 [Magnetococcales bacterium]|nr:hypothetical protein [Magnetococcales bacterium]